jgi:hypothetical protein
LHRVWTPGVSCCSQHSYATATNLFFCHTSRVGQRIPARAIPGIYRICGADYYNHHGTLSQSTPGAYRRSIPG